MIPINVPADKVQLLVSSIACQVGTMPFTYLGLPVGTTRPVVTEFVPI
jgi:hypothetical protein